MSDPHKTRWQFGSGNMEALLQDVAAHKGESLWQDAWRRLKRNRSAFWSMVFLACFGLTSLLAPVLPLASPVALSLRTEAAPPSWPWESPAPKTAETPKGAAITSSFGALFDNGWRHRTTAHLSVTTPPNHGMSPQVVETLTEWLAQESGRTVAKDARAPLVDGAPSSLHLGVPFIPSDAPRTDWTPQGAKGSVVFTQAQGTSAWFEFTIPADETQYTTWRVELSGRRGHLFLQEEAGALTRFRFKLPREFKGRTLGITLNGRHLSPSGKVASASAPGSIAAAPVEAPKISITASFGDHNELLLDALSIQKDTRVLLADPTKESVLFERVTLTAIQERGAVHDDLKRRLDRSLKQLSLPTGVSVSLDEVASENGYWELKGLDPAMLALRTNVFGLWQTGNWMGTDSKGRDIFARIIWGSRTSILVAFFATICSLIIGVTYGAFSGFMGGRIDNLMMRIVDILYSLPFIFVVIFLITIMNEYRTELQDNFGIDREFAFYMVIGAIYWLTMARVVRGQVLSLKNSEFIDAARVIGASTPRILFTHLVPNVLSIVIVYLTLTIPAVMLFESFLSFLGLGIEPPKVSWGTLAVDGTEAVNPIRIYWWLVLFPALAMGSFLLALNVLGDGLRDALDPKLRGKD